MLDGLSCVETRVMVVWVLKNFDALKRLCLQNKGRDLFTMAIYFNKFSRLDITLQVISRIQEMDIT